jgi:Asp-tRNA(Asn)/Glu-tRNA(Gln) amidotransferase A subunit family amidase
MADLDLCYSSASELAGRIRTKEVSPVEVVRNALARLDEVEPFINAFVARDDERALEAAAETERAVMRGDATGPLHGVPVSIKDLIEVAGLGCSYGSLTMRDYVAAADAPSVERLRRAGAIVIGKTTTSEFGYRGYTKSLVHGNTRNIWNLETTPGGSSGGAVSSVAAGVTPIALGTDGGGSIRSPASFTGLVGIKAQFGRIPVYPASATPTLAHVGPIARNVEDAALVLAVTSGADLRDHTSLLPDLGELSSKSAPELNGLRVAFSPSLGYGRVDAEVAEIVQRAVERLAGELGAVTTVDEVCPDPAHILATEFIAGCSARLGDLVDRSPELIDPPLLGAIRTIRTRTLEDYAGVLRQRLHHRDTVRRFFERFDVLLTPTTPVPAWPIEHEGVPPGHEHATVWSYFTYPFNLTGQPAMSMPCGFTRAGLPVGLQIVVRPREEPLMISVARRAEAVLGEIGRRPPEPGAPTSKAH